MRRQVEIVFELFAYVSTIFVSGTNSGSKSNNHSERDIIKNRVITLDFQDESHTEISTLFVINSRLFQ